MSPKYSQKMYFSSRDRPISRIAGRYDRSACNRVRATNEYPNLHSHEHDLVIYVVTKKTLGGCLNLKRESVGIVGTRSTKGSFFVSKLRKFAETVERSLERLFYISNLIAK